MALLSIRPMLLRQHSQLCIPLDIPAFPFPFRGVLYSQPWGCRKRSYNLEE
jgi:hypothetical protein